MKTFNKYVLLYLKWASPIALLAAVLSGFGYSGNTLFYDITGIATVIWIALLVYMVFIFLQRKQSSLSKLLSTPYTQ